MSVSATAIPPFAAAAEARAAVAAKALFPPVAACLGAALIAVSIQDLVPLAAVWPMLGIAGVISWILALGRSQVAWAGWAMFGVSLFAAGASHLYQTQVFGDVLVTTPEATLWYELSRYGPAQESPLVNASYAVNSWRFAYGIANEIGLGDGVWIALIVNASLMAIAATLIAQTAFVAFDGDRRRVARVAALTLLCPMFWMFGGMLVRDSFALVIQATVVLTLVHLVKRGITAARVVTCLSILVLVAVVVRGIRDEMLYTFPVSVGIALVALALKGRARALGRPLQMLSVLGVLAIAAAMLADRFSGFIDSAQEGYSIILTYYDSAQSGLGNRLVASQPLPIRLVTGTLYLHVFPIPVWTGFSLANWDYHWLKSLAGLFMIVLVPRAAVGFRRAIVSTLEGSAAAAPFFFAAIYWLVMTAAVAVTSLETRHVAQFLPAFLLLAVLPDSRVFDDRRRLLDWSLAWYGAVATGHLLWLIIRA